MAGASHESMLRRRVAAQRRTPQAGAMAADPRQRLLSLQRTAGNQAVSALLAEAQARATTSAAIQRMKMPTDKKEKARVMALKVRYDTTGDGDWEYVLDAANNVDDLSTRVATAIASATSRRQLLDAQKRASAAAPVGAGAGAPAAYSSAAAEGKEERRDDGPRPETPATSSSSSSSSIATGPMSGLDGEEAESEFVDEAEAEVVDEAEVEVEHEAAETTPTRHRRGFRGRRVTLAELGPGPGETRTSAWAGGAPTIGAGAATTTTSTSSTASRTDAAVATFKAALDAWLPSKGHGGKNGRTLNLEETQAIVDYARGSYKRAHVVFIFKGEGSGDFAGKYQLKIVHRVQGVRGSDKKATYHIGLRQAVYDELAVDETN
jgi:hypothetical protein